MHFNKPSAAPTPASRSAAIVPAILGILALTVLGLGSCDNLLTKHSNPKPPALSSGKQILDFALQDPATTGTIDQSAGTILLTVPYGTDRTKLVPVFTLSPKATCVPASGLSTDLSAPTTFTITAEDGSTRQYNVTVSLGANTAKAITGFAFLASDNGGLAADLTGVIDENAKTISLQVPGLSNITKLKPSIQASADATVTPAALSVLDFSAPVVFRVTAASGGSQDYTVSLQRKPLTVSTFAGSGSAGGQDGKGSSATFNLPTRIFMDAADNLYVADWGGHKIRLITPDGTVSTVAGTGAAGTSDGPVASATFNAPHGIIRNADGSLLVSDLSSTRIRRIANGNVSTLSTNLTALDLVSDAAGGWFLAARSSNQIFRMTSAGTTSVYAGTGTSASVDNTRLNASFYNPQALAADADGNLWVAELIGNRIRKIAKDGTVSTVAGSGNVSSIDGNGRNASFMYPNGLALDGQGNLYVGGNNDHKVRKIDSAGNVTTLAGLTTSGAVDGPIGVASFSTPCGIAIDRYGSIYIADQMNHKIRKIQ